MESRSRKKLFWMQRFRRQRMWAPQCDAAWDLLTKRIQHLVILVHVYEVTCTVHVDVLDPLIMFQVWAQTSGSIISRRTSDVSLLSSSLLQATTNPHGHHLCVTVVKLYDEGMILKNREDRMLYHCYLESHQNQPKVTKPKDIQKDLIFMREIVMDREFKPTLNDNTLRNRPSKG